MSLRRILFLLVALLCSCSLCYAVQGINSIDTTIEKSELSLGGVTVHMPYQRVVQMYGEPQWKYGDPNNGVALYGDSVRIGFNKNQVTYVLVMANNGWKTPKGISVGMNINEVYRVYGKEYSNEKGAKGDYVVYQNVEGPERRGNTIFMERIRLYISTDLSPEINSLEIYESSPDKTSPGYPEHYK